MRQYVVSAFLVVSAFVELGHDALVGHRRSFRGVGLTGVIDCLLPLQVSVVGVHHVCGYVSHRLFDGGPRSVLFTAAMATNIRSYFTFLCAMGA